MENWDGVRRMGYFFDGDETDLPLPIVNKYFQMLKESELRYKGKVIITGTTPDGKPNHFYEVFLNQDKNN